MSYRIKIRKTKFYPLVLFVPHLKEHKIKAKSH